MSDINATIQRVLDLDREATKGPWTPDTWDVEDGGGVAAAGPTVYLNDLDGAEHDDAMDRAQTDAVLIAEYRTAAPDLARALLAEQARSADLEAQLAAAQTAVVAMKSERDAALARAEQSEAAHAEVIAEANAWRERSAEWTQRESALRAEVQAAVARAEAAERQSEHYQTDRNVLDLTAREACVQLDAVTTDRDALRAELQAAVARADRYAETIAEHTVPLDQFTDMERERDALRADLARVKQDFAENVDADEAIRVERVQLRSDLASARQEAEALRALLMDVWPVAASHAPAGLGDRVLAALPPAPVPDEIAPLHRRFATPVPAPAVDPALFDRAMRAESLVAALRVAAPPAPDSLAVLCTEGCGRQATHMDVDAELHTKRYACCGHDGCCIEDDVDWISAALDAAGVR